MRRSLQLLPSVVAFCLVRLPAAERHEGELHVKANDVAFLGKFCFDYDPSKNPVGKLGFAITASHPPIGEMAIVLLDDEAESFGDTDDTSGRRQRTMHCDNATLDHVSRRYEKFDMSRTRSSEGITFSTKIFEKIRPRWWFVVAIDCSDRERTISYKLHMTNINQGWLKELSMDHCGVRVLVFFFVVYAVLACVQFRATTLNSTARTRHPLRISLLIGILCACWGMAFWLLDAIYMASSGRDMFPLYAGAKFCKSCSKFTLLFVLLLLSRGSCISRELMSKDVWRASVVIVPFLFVCMVLESWGEHAQSRLSTTRSVYRTWPGSLLILADLVLVSLYLSNLFKSYTKELEDTKQRFYKFWGSMYTSAFLALPFSALVTSVVAPHVRALVVVVLSNLIHSLLLGLLVAGLWPERTHEAFGIDARELASTYGLQSEMLMEEEMAAAPDPRASALRGGPESAGQTVLQEYLTS